MLVVMESGTPSERKGLRPRIKGGFVRPVSIFILSHWVWLGEETIFMRKAEGVNVSMVAPLGNTIMGT